MGQRYLPDDPMMSPSEQIDLERWMGQLRVSNIFYA
jgi:hypothetical protein